ncbi:aldose 1-epimerase family protein [Tellurirhabdus rosea]|uniref:aldose 1-epimerase family protein n=1 Tax=Tellurirhabdus rosea TaxID=2674997 RepID=UPI0022560FE6|nr:aldose 1-epimerase family protein [Tellurirhabdus rosea]
MTSGNWKHKFINPAQVGGIETAVLDNGRGRGTRIAWINTGTGLRYKVVLDRAMDIAEAFYNQHSLAWLSHLGVAPPDPSTDRGIGWLRNFGGGLLTTCGLTHIGGPETDAYGERGVHGPISNLPAELESILQPDPAAGRLEFSLTGRIRQTQVFGPCLELRRTISGRLGEARIQIRDEVVNRGNTPAPHMLLYHVNFGWPLVDEGAELIWQGDWQAREGENARIFRPENDFRKCPPPLDEHAGGGEEAAFIRPEADENGQCVCGVHNPALGIAALIRFRKEQLPWLTNWQHWGRGEYVTGLEPGTHPPIGQAAARARQELLFLEPEDSRIYELSLEVVPSDSEYFNSLPTHTSTHQEH